MLKESSGKEEAYSRESNPLQIPMKECMPENFNVVYALLSKIAGGFLINFRIINIGVCTQQLNYFYNNATLRAL